MGTTFTENAVNDEVYLSFFSDNMAGDSDTPAPFTAGGTMILLGIFLVLPLLIMGLGYGFKHSWILWLAVPFWLMAGIYMGFYAVLPFPPTAQHSLILIGLIGTIGCIFGATRMQLTTLTSPVGNTTDDDSGGLDDELKEYRDEMKAYQAESDMYKTKHKKHKPRYF
jgi:hypothetical protein